MVFAVLFLLIFSIISTIVAVKNTQKLNSKKEKFRQDYLNKQRAELDKQLTQAREACDKKRKEYEELEKAHAKASQQLNQSKDYILQLKKSQEDLIASEKSKVDSVMKEYKSSRLEATERELKIELTKKQEQIDEQFNNFIDDVEKKKETAKQELDNWSKKRDAINQTILRERSIAEQTDFYKICLSEETLDDIKTINSIRSKLHNCVALDKLLYDNYISKPTKEMVKRVLSGTDPSGIYKITNIQTQECYIGKSTNVATRWTNHVKSACGLSGVADSMFQRALKKYGVDQFTFELIEKVPKDQLTEREKFYITLFDSTKYGYNMKIG